MKTIDDFTPIEVMLVNRNVNASVDSPLTPIRWNARDYNCVDYAARMEELVGPSRLS